MRWGVFFWGEGEPLALLSMPVRLLRRLTGTALRAAFRSPPAREGFPFPPGPPSPPQRAFIQEDGKTTHHKVRRSVCRSPGRAGGLFSFLLARAGGFGPASRLGSLTLFLFYLSLSCGFSPASGLGRLRGERQGVRGASPSTPPTTPVLPLSAWWRASLSHDVYPVRRSPQGANRRASSRFAGDMRACCGAPALRGSPSRPGSLG